jgi:competence protein ComEC
MLKSDADKVPDLRGLLLVVLVVGWLAGILLSCWLALPQSWILALAALSLIVSVVLWRKPRIRFAGLILLCLCMGAWRYVMVSPVDNPQIISALIGSRTVELQGEIADEPRLETSSTLLIVSVQNISLDNGQTWQETRGEVQVEALGATFDNPYSPHYGDIVELTGKLLAPPSYATPELLASMAFPPMQITDRGGNALLVLLYQWRTDLATILMQALPQPFAALLVALFLSLRTPALKPLIPLFNVTGTAHLIAPSGFKVTLLSGLINSSTHWLSPRQDAQNQLPAQRREGNWRRWLRTGLVLLCITIYTFLSGGGPAALRAGIMGMLLVIAPRLERFYNVYTALAFNGLLMSIADPFILWDTGFQLSFVGTLGILLFTPFFAHLLSFLGRLPLGQYIAEIVAVTLAAQVATLPIFALSFNQISFIAPFANIASVPLLGALLALGVLICVSGLLSVQLALICGWLVWPLLWYVTAAISWCASVPGAYLLVNSLNPVVAWSYYALLACITALLLARWQPGATKEHQRSAPLLSQSTKRIVLGSAALLTILATGAAAWTVQPDGHLTITLLTTNNPTQGQALLLRFPQGQTALIDEGADSVTLARTLDTHLPFWQRSLDLAILTDTSVNNLSGMQDLITRYQIARIVDAGMLHPSASYALWRRTLAEHNLPYTQVRQGATLSLGGQVTFQVLWPPAQLHKSSNEEHDNALILRLLAPGLSILLLNSTSLSDYALKTLSMSLPYNYLQANIAQITIEEGKTFPASLSQLLALIRPSLVLTMPVPARKSKQTTSTESTTPPLLLSGPWQTLDTEQVSTLAISSDEHGWNLYL